MSSATYVKDPDATLDYLFDWSQDLQSGEVIVTSQMTVSNTSVSGLTVNSTTNTPSTAIIWLSGGIVGRTYLVVNQITTDQGRTFVASIVIKVKDR